ncbi:CDP-alcohol phosphatidyltransferase family protein [Arthrobacter sp. zg-ZUI100]|uniref:CDP-alcohol phosphatidyltransferase family protein n=2 Tax=Arthrobacter jiangjiafuii TaxID=2817475 RepID=A0A975M932_9MICC|nr:CDP-alcohol phosphatidyltransferase family protein [Arthrobacter jiangjiafuii]MBP3036982.1 CDP-alcohol phosphatidyltransferase family protein [Arthrobacter jiangjiafuii]MBP3044128.1 CDP-alcohol phosphatidyltransferase family protein [Arthrobacter jiangjiafuii]QWC11681.1 CDP-alcohol phosphatidyltransferase family protein [Arthrobacter jiangjiafuii]
MVPLFIWLLAADDGRDGLFRWLAVATFAVAIYTDKLDGDLARSRGLITDFGKIADPIADKLLIGSALVMLSVLGELWWWVTLVILVREVGITVLRFVVIRYGVMAASRGGKLKTVIQTLAIFLFLLPLAAWLGAWAWWISATVMAAAVVVTVVTGADYVIKAVQLRRRALQNPGQ